MKFYKITDLKLEEPITILAESPSDAANYFIACLHRGLGRVPITEYKVERCPRELVEAYGDLRQIASERRRGLAWETRQGWEHVDPFDELA